MASPAPAEKAPAGKPLKVGSPHDPAEREADRIADLLTAPEEPALPVCAACVAGGAPCAACGGGGDGGVLRRQVAGSGDGGSGGEMVAPPSVARTLSGAGNPLPEATCARFQKRLGMDLSHVRVHTDAHAATGAADLSAAAYTLDRDVVFGADRWRPGTAEGDRLLAHELGHFVMESGRSEIIRRDLIAEAPRDLATPLAKAEWITTTLGGWVIGKSRAIADLLMKLSVGEFIDIQRLLNMEAVMSALDHWDAVRVGTLGPLAAGPARDRLNQVRAEYIFEMTRERGAAQAEVVTHWMIANMYGDDISAVLRLLAGDQRLYRTIDLMPQVQQLLKARGVDRQDYSDRGWEAADIPRGVWAAVGSILDSSPASRDLRGGGYMMRDQELPQAYLEAMTQVQHGQLEMALTPGNVALGALDYMLFNIPSAMVGTGQAVVSGVGEFSRGHVQGGTEMLTGPVILVLTLALGVRAFRQSARVAAMMELTGEGQAALATLRASIGETGLQRVARYVQADSQAAILVREQGLAGIEALARADGSVAAARVLIGVNAARLGSLLGAEALATLGLEAQQALATLSDGAIAGVRGASGATLQALSQLLREASPTMRAQVAGMLERDAAGFSRVFQEQGPAAVTALRSGPIATAVELDAAARRTAGLVRVPVVRDGVTVYESIDPANPPQGWVFRDDLTTHGGTTTIRTTVNGPNGAEGYFLRRFNPATGELEMLEAYLRSNEAAPSLPSAVRGGAELRPGSGTPTGIFASLRQLRRLGVAPGSLRRITLSKIENFATLCRFEWLRRNFPGRPMNVLIMETESVGYAQTTAEQTGSRVASARVIGGETRQIGQVMASYRAEAAQASREAAARVTAEHSQILQRYGFTDETPMLVRFAIELDLEPIPAQPAVPTGTTR